MCQIDVLYGKSLIIDFLDDFLKKRTAIKNTVRVRVRVQKSREFGNTSLDNDLLISVLIHKYILS